MYSNCFQRYEGVRKKRGLEKIEIKQVICTAADNNKKWLPSSVEAIVLKQ